MNQFRKSQNLVSQSRHCITHSLVLCHSQVRFLADLVCVKVVTISSIMSLFDTFLTITYEPGIPQVRRIHTYWCSNLPACSLACRLVCIPACSLAFAYACSALVVLYSVSIHN